MAIAFDAFTSGGLAIPANTLSWSHTCTGSNLILFVGNFGTVSSEGPNQVTSITYNGVGLTKLFDVQLGAQGSERWIDLWYLVGPATGSNTVTVNTNTSNLIMPLSASYTGVDQSAPEVTQNQASTGTTNTNTLTTLTDNAWHVLLAAANPTISMGTGATSRGSNTTAAQLYWVDGNGPVTPAGSNAITINLGTAGNSTTLGASIKPAAAAGATAHNLTLLGVGA